MTSSLTIKDGGVVAQQSERSSVPLALNCLPEDAQLHMHVCMYVCTGLYSSFYYTNETEEYALYTLYIPVLKSTIQRII